MLGTSIGACWGWGYCRSLLWKEQFDRRNPWKTRVKNVIAKHQLTKLFLLLWIKTSLIKHDVSQGNLFL